MLLLCSCFCEPIKCPRIYNVLLISITSIPFHLLNCSLLVSSRVVFLLIVFTDCAGCSWASVTTLTLTSNGTRSATLSFFGDGSPRDLSDEVTAHSSVSPTPCSLPIRSYNSLLSSRCRHSSAVSSSSSSTK
jgi:hypothetical protein